MLASPSKPRYVNVTLPEHAPYENVPIGGIPAQSGTGISPPEASGEVWGFGDE
jgi:hypothetical protein